MSDFVQHKALALFSGGLDSILAARLVQDQGLAVTCLHFISPFFGYPHKVSFWKRTYGLEVTVVDVGEAFARMLVERPVHGFGSVLNPCVDCKILMMRKAKELLERHGASLIVSGEVLGQRPMSQRRDTLNVIRRDAGLKGRLLRPLSALHLDPTEAEEAGIIDRSRLLGITGRGRKQQLELAAQMGITEFPAPAGGCRLTEQENARSYWPILMYAPEPTAADFYLANTGRQYWRGLDEARDMPEPGGEAPGEETKAARPGRDVFRLVVGRKKEDNERLMGLAGDADLLFKTRDFPGPVAVGRFMGREWPQDAVQSAAALVASYCSKAVRHAAQSGEDIAVRVHRGSLDGPGSIAMVLPDREGGWREHGWDETKAWMREAMSGQADDL